MKTFFAFPLFILTLLSGLPISAQNAEIPDPETLLEKAIEYHDPQDRWSQFSGDFVVLSTRPGRSGRTSHIRMDHPQSFFRIQINLDGVDTALEMRGDSCRLEYQGSTEFSEAIAEKHRLNCDRARMWRDYYSYLYGLPMKLKDPGTKISGSVLKRRFKGADYWVLEVKYDPDTGSDTWYFYFDPESYAMRAYQFYHDPAANDGEYILLEDEVDLYGMRIPRKRSWYTNAEEKFLGADLLLETGGSEN